MTKNRV